MKFSIFNPQFSKAVRYLLLATCYSLSASPTVAFAQEGFTYARVVRILFGLTDFVLTIGLVLAVIMIIWYAIQIMTSKNILQAKKGIFWAIVGAAVILGVNVILATVFNIVMDLSR